MKLDKAQKRDKARHKRIKGMQVDGRGVLIIQQTLIERAEKKKKKKQPVEK